MFTDILQPTHLLFVLVVALLVLGPKRLPEVARTLGSGLRDFRSAISGESDEESRPGHVSLGDNAREYVRPSEPSGEMPVPREPDPPIGTAATTEPTAAPTTEPSAATTKAPPALEPTHRADTAEPVTEPTASPDDSAVPAPQPEPATEVRPPEPDHQS